ncbi:MAG: hypothetical protein J0H76_07070 [Sphingobacteriales bacterium]|nr:hypothetical protein [Sphingobacteriales bacterium]
MDTDSPNANIIAVTRDFFNTPEGTDDLTKRIIKTLQHKNELKPFVTAFALKNGYPVWNKTLATMKNSQNPQSFVSSASNNNSNDTLICIPFVKQGSQRVAGFIEVKLSPGDSMDFRYRLTQDYKLLDYNVNESSLNTAENYASLMMQFEKMIFGYSHFKVTDHSLFRPQESDTATLTVGFSDSLQQQNNITVIYQCAQSSVSITWNCPAAKTQQNIKKVSCGIEAVYNNCYIIGIEWDNGIYTGGGTTGVPSTGGGETGGIPYYYLCNTGSNVVNTSQIVPPEDLPECPPATGGPGWEPIPIEDVYDPCAVLKVQNADTAYKNRISYLKTKFNEKKEAGFSENKQNQFTALVPAPSTSNSDAIEAPVDSTIKGFSHNHLNDYEVTSINIYGDEETTLNKPIRIFSPADVDVLMQLIYLNLSSGNFADYYVTMAASDGTYTLKFTGTPADIKVGYGTEEWRKHFAKYCNDWLKKYGLEKTFLTYLRDVMQLNGVGLYKINSNDTIDQVTLTVNNKIIKTPCP